MPSSDEAGKAVFFDQLYALDRLSSDEEDIAAAQTICDTPSTHASFFTTSQSHSRYRTSDKSATIPHIYRTVSLAWLIPSNVASDTHRLFTRPRADASNITLLPTEVSHTEDTPLAQYNLQQVGASPRRTVSAPTPCTIIPSHDMNKPALGKRKRKQLPLKFVPEAQQIFRGLKFFYVPNDDIAPVRRVRIRKAQEHGAIWGTIWGDDEVTHIIVDETLAYKDIISFLKISSIPEGIIMVLDTYPLDCIQFKAILDPTQRQYRVSGHDSVLADTIQQNSASQTSDKSLQLKPTQSKPGKHDYIPPRATSPRIENSTQNELVPLKSTHLTQDSSPGVWLPPATDIKAVIDVGAYNSDSEKESRLNYPAVESGEEDVLEAIIEEARRLQHLPLDDDEDDQPPSREYSPTLEDTNDDNGSAPLEKHHVLSKRVKKGAFRQENFSCIKGGTGKTDDSNPNARTIAILQEMADYYARINDTWRPIAYRKAISTLRNQTTKISSAEEALKLPFIGQRLALKIEEIVITDRLRRLENAKAEPSDHILQKFIGIYGVGFSQASKWLHSGYKTFEDLKAHAHLSENQLLGIDHYEDFQKRIPRDEVTALGTIIKITAAGIDPEIEIIIGGSYRRGAASSGDIDCLITKPNTTTSSSSFSFLNDLVSQLTSTKFLVAALAVPRAESGTKWHGCCVLAGVPNPVWRRIDFLLAPATELGAALIYFTGNDIFNRSIRLLASTKGMRLNQRGLFKNVMRGPGRVKVNEGELVEGADERKIFAALGVPWRPPEHRIC